jgi:hypothetical protein
MDQSSFEALLYIFVKEVERKGGNRKKGSKKEGEKKRKIVKCTDTVPKL